MLMILGKASWSNVYYTIPECKDICFRVLLQTQQFLFTPPPLAVGLISLFRGCDENGKYYAQIGTRPHISGIPRQCATISPCFINHFRGGTTIPTPTCLSRSLLKRSVQTITLIPLNCNILMLKLTYTQARVHTGQVQQPYSVQLVQDHFHCNNSCGCDENGKYCAQSKTQTKSLAFWASALPLHHIGSLMSALYARQPVYAAPCLRSQCRQRQLQ